MAGILLLALLSARPFHYVPLEGMAETRHTHVETCGPVVYVRHQLDGDWHITLDNGKARVVLEIIPECPLVPPLKGQTIRAKGISRFDREHGFVEIHPLLVWWQVTSCAERTGA